MALLPLADDEYKKLADASPYRNEPIPIHECGVALPVAEEPSRRHSVEPMVGDMQRPEPVKSSSVPPQAESVRNSSVSPETDPDSAWEVLLSFLDGLVLAKGAVVAQQRQLDEESSDGEFPSQDPETAEAEMGSEFRVLAYSNVLANDKPLAQESGRKRLGKSGSVAEAVGGAKGRQASPQAKGSAGRKRVGRRSPSASASSEKPAPRRLRSNAKRGRRKSNRLKAKRSRRFAKHKASSDDGSSFDGEASDKGDASDKRKESGKEDSPESGVIISSDEDSF